MTSQPVGVPVVHAIWLSKLAVKDNQA